MEEKCRELLSQVLCPQTGLSGTDEPITGLDPAGKRKFLRLSKNKERGTAVITVTHNLKGFFPLLETIVLMKEGK